MAVPSQLVGQECTAGVVEEVVFDRGKPFDDDTAGPEATLGWLFRTMNALHVRTRESTLRWELLVAESDCLDPARIAESERTLRQLPYIVDAGVTAEPLENGAHRVVVRTRDSWAASAGASFSLDGGITITGLSASAKNILGTGTRGSLFRTSFRERKRTGLLVRQPNVLGSRLDVTAMGGQTQPGRFWGVSTLRPFSGELGAWAFRQSWIRRDDYFSYSAPVQSPFTHAYRQVVSERFDIQLQRRFGNPGGNRLLLGAGWGRESLRRPSDGDDITVVLDGDFDAPAPAAAVVDETLLPQAGRFDVDRVFGIVGLRRVRFVERTALDAISAEQDVPYGATLTAVIGPSVGEREGSASDTWARVQASASWGGARTYLHLRGDVEGRRPAGTNTWYDVIHESELLAYWNQRESSSLFVRVEVAGGHRMTRPFQLTLGGWTGVRGYVEDAFPAARRLVVNIEQRTSLFGWSPGLAEVGVALFVDAGRTSGPESVPFGAASDWRASIGAGLRWALPRGSQDVVRVDVGTPVTGDRATRGVTLRIYTELFGLLDRRGWPSQVQRSRWSGLDADLTRRPQNPLAGS